MSAGANNASTATTATSGGSANRRYWIIGILAALVLVFFLLVGAPASNRIDTGSTWGKAPDGYGAWYAYMEAQGAPIKRWQRPISELVEQDEDNQAPATVIRVIPPAIASGGPSVWQAELADWLERGDRLIVLTQQGPVTAANFSTQLDSAFGKVTVETRRRYKLSDRDLAPYGQTGQEISSEPNSLNGAVQDRAVQDRAVQSNLLADEQGAVVWRSVEQPNVILSTTPFIAANAYQEASGNFAFLADLAREASGPIWIDEYLHGYKDRDVVVEEVAGTWLGYLAKTPLIVVAVQVGVILLVALVAQNRRIGLRRSLSTPLVNNSEAYIKALAGVLHKANNRDFLVETLALAEQKSLQRALGLGDAAVSLETLQAAWHQSTGRSVEELAVLRAMPKGDSALQTWLRQLQSLSVTASQRANAPATERANNC